MDEEHKSLQQLPKNPQLLNYQTRIESKSFDSRILLYWTVNDRDPSLRASIVIDILAAELVSFTLDKVDWSTSTLFWAAPFMLELTLWEHKWESQRLLRPKTPFGVLSSNVFLLYIWRGKRRYILDVLSGVQVFFKAVSKFWIPKLCHFTRVPISLFTSVFSS